MPAHRWFLPGLATLIVAGSLAAHAAALPAGWEAPADLAGAGPAAGPPSAAGNARGDLAVAWIAVTPGGRRRAHVAVRPAGATGWSRALGVGPATDRADGLALALAPDGRLVVAWKTAARATPGRVVTRAALVSADSRRRAVRVLGRSDGRFPSFVFPPAVAFTATGRAAVAWISPGPAGGGRALVAVAPRSGVFGIPRRLDRGGDGDDPGVCPDESGVRLSARSRGGLVAWWDCDDDVRDHELRVALAGSSGRFAAAEATGVISRGSTGAALAADAGGVVVGAWTENDDDEFGSHLRSLTRSPGGRWSGDTVRVVPPPGQTDLTPFPYAQPSAIIAGAPATGYLAAWIAPNEGGAYRDRVWAVSGPDAGAAFGVAAPIGALGPEGGEARLGGVGITAAGGAAVVWAQESATSAGAQAIWTAARPDRASAFGSAEEVDIVGEIVGSPSFVLNRGGVGAAAWSQGPAGRAVVRVSAIRLS